METRPAAAPLPAHSQGRKSPLWTRFHCLQSAILPLSLSLSDSILRAPFVSLDLSSLRSPNASSHPAVYACSRSHLAILQGSTQAVQQLFDLVDELERRNSELERGAGLEQEGRALPCVLNANSEAARAASD